MHEVLESDSEPRVFDEAVVSMPVSLKSNEISTNIKQNNEALKIRKNFVETWLWNQTITGYELTHS